MLFQFITSSPSSFLPYCLLGLLTLVEGPLTSLIGGAASSSGLLLPIPAYFSVVLGNLVADLGWYSLGRFGKRKWLARLAPKVGLNPGLVAQLQTRVHQHAPRLIFFSKLTVGFPIPTLVATGLSQVPLRRWAIPWILAELLKSAALLTLGYLTSHTIQQASTGVQVVLWSLTLLLVLAGLLWNKRRKKKNTVGAIH